MVHSGPLVEVVHWRCLHDGPALRSVRAYANPVLTVPLHGVSRVIHEKGDLLADSTGCTFHSPGIPYSTRHPRGVGDLGCNFAFPEELFEEALDRADDPAAVEAALGTAGPPRTLPLSASRLVMTSLLAHGANDEGSVDPLLAEEVALHLLDAVVTALSTAGTAQPPARRSTARLHGRIVDRTLLLLHEEPERNWTLAEIGRRVASSPFHLARIFRRATGHSIHRYRTRLRLAQAMEAVQADPERRLDEIALEAGFSSHGHLCTAFSRHLETSPSSLREPRELLRRKLAEHPAELLSTH